MTTLELKRSILAQAETIIALRAQLAESERRRVELVEAVKTLRSLECGIPEMGMLGAHKIITEAARAEVDRLIGGE